MIGVGCNDVDKLNKTLVFFCVKTATANSSKSLKPYTSNLRPIHIHIWTFIRSRLITLKNRIIDNESPHCNVFVTIHSSGIASQPNCIHCLGYIESYLMVSFVYSYHFYISLYHHITSCYSSVLQNAKRRKWVWKFPTDLLLMLHKYLLTYLLL